MELPHLIVFYLFLEQFHTDYSKYTYMPRRQAASQDKARQAATIAVNDGRPLSFCRKSKWNLTEKKITSCSFQWVDIILFSLGFFLPSAPLVLRSTHCVCVCAISTCTGLLRVCVCECVHVCVCVWVLHHHLPGCASRSSCFLSIFYLFILCLRTYAPSSLTGVADWVAAWLTSWLPLSLSLPPPPPACHPL